jgi:hypothetical protein
LRNSNQPLQKSTDLCVDADTYCTSDEVVFATAAPEVRGYHAATWRRRVRLNPGRARGVFLAAAVLILGGPTCLEVGAADAALKAWTGQRLSLFAPDALTAKRTQPFTVIAFDTGEFDDRFLRLFANRPTQFPTLSDRAASKAWQNARVADRTDMEDDNVYRST